MQDHALETAVAAYLKKDLTFNGVFFTGYSPEERHAPSITLEAKSQGLDGSMSVFRGELSVIIETEAHDSDAEAHAALVESVRVALADKAAVSAGINEEGGIVLYGFVFFNSGLEVEATRFRTTFVLKAGYGVVAH